MTHEQWLQKTIELAIENVEQGGGPFAALLVKNGNVLGQGANRVHIAQDPSAHAELLAIREACTTLQTTDLSDCILYASGEPCPMCLGAAYWAKVGKIYYACNKVEAAEETGFANPLKNFFPDQSIDPDNRSVPFIQLKTDNALDPFLVFQKRNDSTSGN